MHIKFIEYIYIDIKGILYLILTSIAVLEDYAYKIHRVYLSWHLSSYLDIELFYLDIEVLLFILTSIAISKEHAYKFHRKYLSWHSIIVIFILTLHHIYILSWHPLQFWRIIHINFIEYIYLDIELFYLDIQVLLSILTSIAILKEHVYKFDGVYPSWHYNSFHLIFTSITVSRSMLLNVIWCIYLDIKPLLHLILTSIWYVYLDIQSLHVLYWHKQVKKN